MRLWQLGLVGAFWAMMVLGDSVVWAQGNQSSQTSIEATQFAELRKATKLMEESVKLFKIGKYQEALPLVQMALKIRESQLGPNHPDVAMSLNNLAVLYEKQGRYREAELIHQRSLKIEESQLGENHPNVALTLNNLAFLYHRQGRYAEAEPLFQRSLKIREQQLGPNHLDVALTLNNLAVLYEDQGRYAEVEPLYQRSLKIREQQLGLNHPDVAISLNNLAALYQGQNRNRDAEPLLKRALKIREQRLGADHLDVATSLNSLAFLYNQEGRRNEAESLYQRSLRIRESRLGPNHPDVAISLSNLALLYQNQGRNANAEQMLKQSLEIRAKQFGVGHPSVSLSLNNLAGFYQRQGRYSEALAFWHRGLESEEINLRANLLVGAEAQKQDYIKQFRKTIDVTISFHLQDQPNNPQAAELALTTLLRRKGRILDVTVNSLDRLRQNLTPEDQKLLDQLIERTSQLAKLPYSPLQRNNPQQYREIFQALTQEVNERQSTLARRSAAFREETESATIAAIQQQIPHNAALVEIVRYQPLNIKADQQWGNDRYGAYILNRDGKITAVDLGEAKPIDQLISAFQADLQDPLIDVRSTAQKLESAVMRPIRAQLPKHTQQILLSPDSQLNLIPFAALVDADNRYLIESYAISYLSSGRDLLRFTKSSMKSTAPLIVANPDYDNATKTTTAAQIANRRSIRFKRSGFDSLIGTEQEGRTIAQKLPGAILLTGAQATEAALQQVKSPRILHLATHGFFEPGDVSVIGDNPLLRSSLALAGANTLNGGNSNSDGIFTALEASQLNLQGTQLVVLSACETGLGDVANGEGIYGLRRAFALAGAQMQVMSLWKVDDAATQQLMVRYYDALLAGKGRSEALYLTQRGLLQDPQYSHPYYWASFIPSGNWQPLAK
jgi:CHAT domain-containing protein